MFAEAIKIDVWLVTADNTMNLNTVAGTGGALKSAG
jgi:hypothetical protein